jgi:fibronectin-binding autotransporter adhesin
MRNTPKLRHFLLLASSALLAVSSAHADIRNWDGDTSVTWSDAANWDTLPLNSLTADIANFNLATYDGVSVFAPNAGTTAINGITIGASNGAMTLTTTNLSIGGSGLTIANGAGALNVAGNVTIGANQTWTNNDNDDATFSQILLGNSRTLTLAAGNFVNNAGDTTFTANSGTTGNWWTGTTGELQLGSGATFSTPKGTSIGHNSSGIKATVTGSGGTWDVGNQFLSVGYTSGNNNSSHKSDNNILEIHGGATVENVKALRVGNKRNTGNNPSANNNSLLVTGGGRLFTLEASEIGRDTRLSGPGSHNNSVTITGTDSLWDLNGANLEIGYTTNGSDSTGNKLIIADNGVVDKAGTITINKGFASSNSLEVKTGGTLYLNQLENGLASAATFTFDNGTLVARSNNASFWAHNASSTVDIQAGGLTVDSAGNAITIGQNLAGAGGLTKTGTGTLTLSGTNTYTGGTTVSADTLTIDGSLGDASMTITNGTVNGSGTLTFNIDGAAFNQIAMSNGTLNVTGMTLKIPSGANLTEAEYVVVNRTGGTLTGPFAGLNDAAGSGYVLDYDTPDQIKLVSGSGATGYAAWATGNEPFDGDANGDGVKDGIAFLLGAATPGTDASGLLPTVTEDGSGNLVLNFNCLPVAARGGATLKVAHSNTLASWTATTAVVPDTTNATPDNNVTFVVGAGPVGPPALNSVTATIGSAAAADGKLFGRLEATE